jgi:hypothetical protein
MRVFIDIPDELIHEIKNLEEIYNMNLHDLAVTAIKLYVDKRRRILYQDLKF